MTDYTLSEFEAWCHGKGRGNGSGKHWNSIKHIEHFRAFKRRENEKREALERQAKQAEKG